jgi:hypothetical protein
MIEVPRSRPDELQHFYDLDQDPDAREHINRSTLQQHQQEFARADIVYLSIYANTEVAG